MLELNQFYNNSSLSTDFYNFTMAYAYFSSQQNDKIGIFEMYIRKLPNNRAYLVAVGLKYVIDFLLNFKFKNEYINFLKTHKIFKGLDKNFFDYLLHLKFTGNLWAISEGSIIFANEPILRIEAPIIEAQLVETFILSMINFQTLIASKASRIINASKNTPVIEFGFRRAPGPSGALLATRSCYIAGCLGTSNTLASYELGIPSSGTMSHSFVLSFENEELAFKEFLKVFPQGFLLIDTYDSMKAVKKIIQNKIKCKGLRIDSGDLLKLSKDIRKLLDNGGYASTKIMASGDLNEYIITDLKNKKAPIDIFGVGTELITSRDEPVLNSIYKLVAIKRYSKTNNRYEISFKMKTSINKISYPGPKQVFRFEKNNRFIKDIITLENETIDNAIPLLIPYLQQGKLVQKLPNLVEIKDYHQKQIASLPDRVKKISNKQEEYPVFLSEKLIEVMKVLQIKSLN
ncbi:MAG TPA: nicotinate phosphoribosyltransferase [Nitrososphaeraceae archaeon]|nr:nicotinate phosphoribosyltransferase [Nitrososphaeraceae archaeon]